MKKNITHIYMSKVSNNKYLDCPARMSDGRSFTDYRSSTYTDDMIRYSNNLMTSFEFRQFLTNNADQIMEINNKKMDERMSCTDCNAPTMPFERTCVYNNASVKCHNDGKNGVGLRNVVEQVENFIEGFEPTEYFLLQQEEEEQRRRPFPRRLQQEEEEEKNRRRPFLRRQQQEEENMLRPMPGMTEGFANKRPYL
jgi:hypothetical protein